MSADYRTVDIRAGPPTPGDRIVLGEIPVSDASELAATLQGAADAPEAPHLRAGVPDAQDTVIANGWFG